MRFFTPSGCEMRSASALTISSNKLSGAVYNNSASSGTARWKRGVTAMGMEMPVCGVGISPVASGNELGTTGRPKGGVEAEFSKPGRPSVSKSTPARRRISSLVSERKMDGCWRCHLYIFLVTYIFVPIMNMYISWICICLYNVCVYIYAYINYIVLSSCPINICIH